MSPPGWVVVTRPTLHYTMIYESVEGDAESILVEIEYNNIATHKYGTLQHKLGKSRYPACQWSIRGHLQQSTTHSTEVCPDWKILSTKSKCVKIDAWMGKDILESSRTMDKLYKAKHKLIKHHPRHVYCLKHRNIYNNVKRTAKGNHLYSLNSVNNKVVIQWRPGVRLVT